MVFRNLSFRPNKKGRPEVAQITPDGFPSGYCCEPPASPATGFASTGAPLRFGNRQIQILIFFSGDSQTDATLRVSYPDRSNDPCPAAGDASLYPSPGHRLLSGRPPAHP